MKEKKKKLRKTNSHNKNSEQDISHETEPTNTSNSQENTENNDIEKEKKMIFYKTKSYILRKILPTVTQGNILVKRQQINLKD